MRQVELLNYEAHAVAQTQNCWQTFFAWNQNRNRFWIGIRCKPDQLMSSGMKLSDQHHFYESMQHEHNHRTFFYIFSLHLSATSPAFCQEVSTWTTNANQPMTRFWFNVKRKPSSRLSQLCMLTKKSLRPATAPRYPSMQQLTACNNQLMVNALVEARP